ncbi:MAG: V-type ATP synthase subunit D [Candidatus Brockarchaeota archaeon]|nr:V-type ATP synthase subunit D [Candidatus Brockarchaeota archaeon]
MSLVFKPTRHELFKLDRLLNIALRSSSIMRQRYQLLNQELLKNKDELKRIGIKINMELPKIYRLLDEVEEKLGENIVRRAAATMVRLNEVEFAWRNVKGVLVPKISYSKSLPEVEDRGYYPLETSKNLDRVSESMHRFLETLINYVNLVARQKTLTRELKKIERRSKALDHALIPNLILQRKRIMSKLEEIEREELSRKKRVKQLLESESIFPRAVRIM